MKLRNLFIILLLLFPLNLLFTQTQDNQRTSQTQQDRDRFNLLLEKETSRTERDTYSPAFFTLVPERLPAWINQIPAPSNNKIYILGISDPGMDEETGLIVAKLRLKTIYALLTGIRVNNMRDFYIRERQTGYANAFIDYTQFTSKINADFSEINIIESYVTKYDETILLGEVDLGAIKTNDTQDANLQITAAIMSNARRVGTRTEMVSKTDLKTKYRCEKLNKVIELSYEANAISRRVNTETQLNGKKISSLPAINLRYVVENENTQDTIRTEQMSYSLRNGIWYSYLTAIMFELADMAHGNAFNVANIHEIFDDIMQNLTREIVSNYVSCEQLQLMIRSNNLFLNCGSFMHHSSYKPEQQME